MEQRNLTLRTADDEESEIVRERHEADRFLRQLVIVIDEEIGRKAVGWALQMDPAELSRRLTGAEGKRPDHRMVLYALRHEKAGRLAALLAEQSGYLPPQRPERLTDAEFRRRAEEALRESGPVGEALRARILGPQSADAQPLRVAR